MLTWYRGRLSRFRQCSLGQRQAHSIKVVSSYCDSYHSRNRLRNHGNRHFRSRLETCKDGHCTPQPQAHVRHSRPIEHTHHALGCACIIWPGRPLPLPRILDCNSLLRARTSSNKPHQPPCIPRREPHLRHLLAQSAKRHGQISAPRSQRPR